MRDFWEETPLEKKTINKKKIVIDDPIKTLGTFKNRKVAILGDMLELGENEKKYHQEIGEFCNEKIDVLIIAIL